MMIVFLIAVASTVFTILVVTMANALAIIVAITVSIVLVDLCFV